MSPVGGDSSEPPSDDLESNESQAEPTGPQASDWFLGGFIVKSSADSSREL